MPHPENRPLKMAIYRDLMDGFTPRQIADRQHASEPLINYHIKRMEKDGIIFRKGTGKPALYTRGPNSSIFETQETGVYISGGHSPPYPTTSHTDRIDKPWFRTEVLRIMDPELKWWDKEILWGKSRRKHRQFVLSNGRLASLEVYDNRWAIIKIEPLQLKSEVIDSGEGEIYKIASAYAMEVVRLTAKACKISLALDLEPIGEWHTGHPIPRLKGVKTGHIKTSETSWIDDSPGGRPEWETIDLTEHIIFHQLPQRVLVLENGIAALKEDNKEIKKALNDLIFTVSRLVSIFEKLTGEAEKPAQGSAEKKDDGDWRVAYR